MGGSPNAVVVTDADNTLWDTNKIFADAQLQLLTAVEQLTGLQVPSGTDRLTFLRVYDQELAQRHHAGLRYPPALLVRALALGLTGAQPSAAARRVWRGPQDLALIDEGTVERVQADFLAALKKKPGLRPGVRRGLQQLRDLDCLTILVTENSKAACERSVNDHHLAGLIARIISAPKHPALYHRIAQLAGRAPCFVVGDQLDRDILPAQQAALRTVFFPGGFRPKWTEKLEAKPDFVISSFDQVAKIVRAHIGELRATGISEPV